MKIFEHKASYQEDTIISVEKHRDFSPAGKFFCPASVLLAHSKVFQKTRASSLLPHRLWCKHNTKFLAGGPATRFFFGVCS
jgi:hypothetical protein